MNKDKILEQLKEINYPGFSRRYSVIRNCFQVSSSNDLVQVKIELNTQDETIPQKLEEAINSRLLQK